MTLLAERFGARNDWVVAAHSMRLVMVVIAVPFGMQWAQHQWGLKVDASWLPTTLGAMAGFALSGLGHSCGRMGHAEAGTQQPLVYGCTAGFNGGGFDGLGVVGGAQRAVKCRSTGHRCELGYSF